MLVKLRPFLLVLLISTLPTFAIWLPFFLGVKNVLGVPLPTGGMATVVSNYDGPLYIVVAKTLYNVSLIKQNFSFDLPVEYYAAHFPLYPLLIRGLDYIIQSYPYSMLVVTTLSSIFAIWFFYKFIGDYVDKKHVLFATLVFAIFPARFLIVRSVGSPEPLFVGSIIASLFYFKNKKYWLAGIFGAIAQATKSPGILLFVAYFFAVLLPPLKHAAQTSISHFFHKFEWRAYPLLLMPLTLLGIFVVYKLTMNDFLAYFHSGDNIHLFFPPFQIFNYSQSWVGTFWLEEVIFVYLFCLLGIMQLMKKSPKILLIFVSLFFATTIFVSHRDIIRYTLPIVPFLFVGFSSILEKKEFRWVTAFLIIPIYLFSLAYISQNHMQISDWAPLL